MVTADHGLGDLILAALASRRFEVVSSDGLAAERADRERLRPVLEAAKNVVDAYYAGRSEVAMWHAIKGLVGEWTDSDHPLVRHDP